MSSGWIALALAMAPGTQASEAVTARAGDLSVAQFAVDDPERLEREWAAAATGGRLSTSTQTVRGRPLFVHVVLSGCRAGPEGKCNVTADIAVTDPNGKSYGGSKGVEVWRASPPPPGVFMLSPFTLGMRVEAGEPLGAYRIRVTTRDNVAKVEAVTEQLLTVGAAR